jgi:hypothetical protein
MKTISTYLVLVMIIVTCIVSGALYLDAHYNTSAILTIIWIVSITLWIKSNGFLENKEVIANK